MTAVLEPTCAPLAATSGDDLAVPLVQGGTVGYANFDYAASAPAIAAVTDRVSALLPYYASVHRGAGYASRVSTDCYESARGTVGAFFDAADDQVTVFTRGTTDSLNLLAGCVQGDTVVLDIEHHANLLPWLAGGRRVVTAADTVAETLRGLVAELCREPAALLAVTGASNVTGELLPLRELAEIAHSCGARLLVDAAQLAPHRRISLRDTGIDYLVCSGHKLYAPFGAGVLVGRRDWLDTAEPYLAGGGAVRSVSVTGTEWAPAPQRHEGGSPNVLGAAALAAACEALAAIPEERFVAHERALTERLRAGLAGVPGVAQPRIFTDSGEGVGIVAFTVEGFAPGHVAAYLSAEHGIGVRDGRFCAHPLLERLGLPAALRASVGVGTTVEHVDRLISALHALVRGESAWSYAAEGGAWSPVPETRPLGADALGTAPCAGF
ncbi:aminotransferase class V-fold PLP-dependent enzyme [Nocardia asteroides]|uniref:aminotransferase class V-fold PLP-dependent enzyme n=1 Tax=Nocardia asteroides TaxID=1824 RepID=UPI001E5CE14C|nr:aminotransferase class V-fold PLP-dependent enzyme [Nocardia asteroides]UGT59568.1 aminotransferase class V-fold PLP-dependent enzyme [Nocardia asteroides]